MNRLFLVFFTILLVQSSLFASQISTTKSQDAVAFKEFQKVLSSCNHEHYREKLQETSYSPFFIQDSFRAAIAHCAQSGNLRNMLRVGLDHGAHVVDRSAGRMNSLTLFAHMARSKDKKVRDDIQESMHLLVDKGAPVHEPLAYATSAQNHWMVKSFLRFGANPVAWTHKQDPHCTALSRAQGAIDRAQKKIERASKFNDQCQKVDEHKNVTYVDKFQQLRHELEVQRCKEFKEQFEKAQKDLIRAQRIHGLLMQHVDKS